MVQGLVEKFAHGQNCARSCGGTVAGAKSVSQGCLALVCFTAHRPLANTHIAEELLVVGFSKLS